MLSSNAGSFVTPKKTPSSCGTTMDWANVNGWKEPNKTKKKKLLTNDVQHTQEHIHLCSRRLADWLIEANCSVKVLLLLKIVCGISNVIQLLWMPLPNGLFYCFLCFFLSLFNNLNFSKYLLLFLFFIYELHTTISYEITVYHTEFIDTPYREKMAYWTWARIQHYFIVTSIVASLTLLIIHTKCPTS